LVLYYYSIIEYRYSRRIIGTSFIVFKFLEEEEEVVLLVVHPVGV